ncbi:MAG: CarD family transcriptional regulator [Coriobacteriales bacterium]|jgi:CarD family transcriptional regulator|nr:CarD family transcriptional regulator [Coriobacteriales bacterium]MDO5708608.1 CarD family transcriptional regulator [Coriobacteriales bacterium]
MYEVGEFIVHPGQGVCRIDEVVDTPQQTYLLMPVGVRHPIRISFPVSGEDRLRPVVSQQEAQELINDYADLGIIEYQGRGGALEEEFFRTEIRNGTCRDTVAVVKTFRERIAEVRSRNKKPPVAYERILKQARDRSLSELSIALDLPVEDVIALFQEQDPTFSQN